MIRSNKANLIGGVRLKPSEASLLETVLEMKAGYVLGFSDRTIGDFFARYDVDIHAPEYQELGTSKAKKIRGFLGLEKPPLVGRVLSDLLEERLSREDPGLSGAQIQAFRRIAARFGGGNGRMLAHVGGVDTPQHRFDVAVSFAGEDRREAESIANACIELGLKVFYDKYEQADLWGKDLYQHLSDVYKNQARFCIVFVSEAYARKLWTKHEFRSAQARAFTESQEYILPIRLDATELPGLSATVGYLEYAHVKPAGVAKMVELKITLSDRL